MAESQDTIPVKVIDCVFLRIRHDIVIRMRRII